MRCALVSFEYPPFAGGGIGTYAGIMAELLSREHEIHVVTNAWDENSPEGSTRCGAVWVHRVRALTRQYEPPATASARERAAFVTGGPPLLWSLKAADCLAEIHRRHRLDIAEFPECFAEAHVVLRRRRSAVDFADLPITITLHTPIWEHHTFNLLSRRDVLLARRSRMEDECILWADGLSSPSRSLWELVSARLGLAADRCDIIPYPVPPAGPGAGPSASERLLLFVGRLEARKGVQTLVTAALAVLRDYPDARLVVVGGSGEVGAQPGRMIDAIAAQLTSDEGRDVSHRVELMGLQPRSEVLALQRRASVCVFPALWDNFPLACCEAMAAGACVVASRVGGLAEMIEPEVSGLLVPAQDPQALALALGRCLDDAALRARLGEGAKQRIAALAHPDVIVPRRLAHYRRVAARMAT